MPQKVENSMSKKKDSGFASILVIYCLGLLIGGLFVGMVAPVRTVIQLDLGLDDSTGIWMINIYTLFYAALIPIIGKVADKYGRNRVFSICILVFMCGALICGISAKIGGFPMLLAGRIIQASGAGGMIPVANAEIGTSFPKEKRGFALGIAAAVSGISNVLGSGVGSAIVQLVGAENWSVMFYIAAPICIILFILTRIFLRKNTTAESGKMDYAGSVLFIAQILLLLLGLKGLDFFNIGASITNPMVWIPLVLSIILTIIFIFVERRAKNPVFHIEFLHSKPIVITMITSFFIGCIIIAMMLVPEYAEYIMNAPAGSGGYYMLAIGITSMIGPPLGGKLVDKWGPKPVLISGLMLMIGAYLFLAFYVSVHPSIISLVIGLAVVGLGLGFAMGSPTNYMILENTKKEDSTSAIATVALVRQVGTTIAPAIFVGFISENNGILGYQQMLICITVFCVIATLFTIFYRSPIINKSQKM